MSATRSLQIQISKAFFFCAKNKETKKQAQQLFSRRTAILIKKLGIRWGQIFQTREYVTFIFSSKLL